MAAKVAAKVGPIGPLQSLPGTGGPEFFKVADKLGWQGSYTPEDFCSAYEVSKAVNNPVLVRNLPAEATSAQVELAAKAFGKVTNVTVPKGQSFAFVTFDSSESADKCVAGLSEVAGAKVEVQSAKKACAEVDQWRRSLSADK